MRITNKRNYPGWAAIGAILLLILSLPRPVAALGGSFSTTGSLVVAREAHTATVLPNGKVLVVGGYNSGALASAELYDPTTGAFSATGSMTTARYFPTATLLPNGKVLVAGGTDGSLVVASAELYDPTTGTFSATGSMTSARYVHTATPLPGGKVLVAGGIDNFGNTLPNAELYDPTTGTFSATGSMTTPRYQHTASLLPNGKVLVPGGADGSLVLASAELYDPTTGTFSATGSMTTARYVHTATLLPNGRVVVAGGYGSSGFPASAELYDPTMGTFSTTGSMTTGRGYYTATPLPNGTVLVAGGIDNSGGLASAELYDPTAGIFSTTGSMITARYQHTATLLPGGKVLVAGGETGNSIPLASAELYEETVIDTAAPIVSSVAISPNPVAVNTSSTLTATLDDSTTGGSNIASAYYSVNGGTPSQMLLTPSAAVTTQASAALPPFAQSNVYSVCVHGTDSAGNTSGDICVLLPVYDPTGGFVTGGGEVASPAGVDLLNTSAAGPATFGFVSKYLPGMNIPSGNLEFQFKQGNLDFKSTSMDWLVVTGEPRAKFHGTGTVNGTNVCNFEVDAWAGSFTGNVDAFGLKITSCSSGGDRYSLPATALTHGRIIIHK
jgi:hypothetical protein